LFSFVFSSSQQSFSTDFESVFDQNVIEKNDINQHKSASNGINENNLPEKEVKTNNKHQENNLAIESQPFTWYKNIENGQIYSNGSHYTANISTQPQYVLNSTTQEYEYYQVAHIDQYWYLKSAYGLWRLGKESGVVLLNKKTNQTIYDTEQWGIVYNGDPQTENSKEITLLEKNTDNVTLEISTFYNVGVLRTQYQWHQGRLKIQTNITAVVAGNYRISLQVSGLDQFTTSDLIHLNASNYILNFEDMASKIDLANSDFSNGNLTLVSKVVTLAASENRVFDPTTYETIDANDYYLQNDSTVITSSVALPSGFNTGTGFIIRSYLSFPLSFVDKYSIISSATITLTVRSKISGDIGENHSLLGFDITKEPFTESNIVFNSSTFNQFYLQNGSNYNSTIALTGVNNGDKNTWNVNDFVQEWITGRTSSINKIGWQLRAVNESEDNAISFQDAQNGANEPYLTITWTTDTTSPWIDCELCRQGTWQNSASNIQVEMYDLPALTGSGLNTSTLAYSVDGSDYVEIDGTAGSTTTLTEEDFFTAQGDAMDFTEGDHENVTAVNNQSIVSGGNYALSAVNATTTYIIMQFISAGSFDADKYNHLHLTFSANVGSILYKIQNDTTDLTAYSAVPTTSTTATFELDMLIGTQTDLWIYFISTRASGFFNIADTITVEDIQLNYHKPKTTVDLSSVLSDGSYELSFRVADLQGNWGYSNSSFGKQYYPKFTGSYAYQNTTAQIGWGEDWTETTTGWGCTTGSPTLVTGIFNNAVYCKGTTTNAMLYAPTVNPDISQYSSLVFWAKGNKTITLNTIRFYTPTNPDFSYEPDITITTSWVKYSISFSSFTEIGTFTQSNLDRIFITTKNTADWELYFDGLHFENIDGDSKTEAVSGDNYLWRSNTLYAVNGTVSTDSSLGYESINFNIPATDFLYSPTLAFTNAIDISNFDYFSFVIKANESLTVDWDIYLYSNANFYRYRIEDTITTTYVLYNIYISNFTAESGTFNSSLLTKMTFRTVGTTYSVYIDSLNFYQSEQSFQYDTTAPIISISSFSEDQSNPWDHVAYDGATVYYSNQYSTNSPLNVTISVADATSGLNIINTSVAWGEITNYIFSASTYSATININYTISNGETATATVTFTVQDSAGNTASTSFTTELDNTAPTGLTMSVPFTTVYYPNLVINLTEATDSGSGIYCYTGRAGDASYNYSTYGQQIIYGVNNGIWVVNASVYDMVGNGDTTGNTFIQVSYDGEASSTETVIDPLDDIERGVLNHAVDLIIIILMSITLLGVAVLIKHVT